MNIRLFLKASTSAPIISTKKSIATSGKKAVHTTKGKKFIPIYHFHSIKGDIRTKYFIIMNFLENNYLDKSFLKFFQRKTPKLKIDLDDKLKQVWVKKTNYQCLLPLLVLGHVLLTLSTLIVDVLG